MKTALLLDGDCHRVKTKTCNLHFDASVADSSSIFIIDQDQLLRDSGLIVSQPTRRLAIAVTDEWSETRIGEYLCSTYGATAERTHMNQLIASRTGLDTVSLDSGFLLRFLSDPNIVHASSISDIPKRMRPIEIGTTPSH